MRSFRSEIHFFNDCFFFSSFLNKFHQFVKLRNKNVKSNGIDNLLILEIINEISRN